MAQNEPTLELVPTRTVGDIHRLLESREGDSLALRLAAGARFEHESE